MSLDRSSLGTNLDGVSHLLGRIEGKIDALTVGVAKLDDAIKNHDERLSHLERAHARFKGGTAILVTLFSAVMAIAAVFLRYAHRE